MLYGKTLSGETKKRILEIVPIKIKAELEK
jgi:hypothetical protein